MILFVNKKMLWLFSVNCCCKKKCRLWTPFPTKCTECDIGKFHYQCQNGAQLCHNICFKIFLKIFFWVWIFCRPLNIVPLFCFSWFSNFSGGYFEFENVFGNFLWFLCVSCFFFYFLNNEGYYYFISSNLLSVCITEMA